MKRSQTIKIADHKRKGAFYPLEVSRLCSKYEIKSSQAGWGDGSAAKVLARAKHLSPRTRTLSRARAYCPARSLPRSRASALLCHAHAHQSPTGPRAWPTHAGPHTGASSLTPGLAARSAAVSALPGTRAFPPQPPPWPTQGPTRD